MATHPSLPIVALLRHRHLALACRLLIGGVFLFSASTKLVHLQEFAQALRGYDLFPAQFVSPLAIYISWVELILGAFLFFGLRTRIAAGLAGILMISFFAVMGLALVQGKSIDCGCFSGVLEETIGPATVLRDGFLMVLLVPVFFSPYHRLSLDAVVEVFHLSPKRYIGAVVAFVLLFAILAGILNLLGTERGVTLADKGEDHWRLGPEVAAVQIIVFSDFQ